jgi:hypothetical protein
VLGCRPIRQDSRDSSDIAAATLNKQVSEVEPELDDVAVLNDVFLAFDAELAGFAGFALGAEGDGVVERKDRFEMQGEINNAFKPAQPIGYLAPQKAKS